MEEMIFAPIIIPTLNRAEHLQRCLESLSKCRFAEKTELFISVDYPSAEKYKDGYNKICAYLQKDLKGFKETHIYYQEKNWDLIKISGI